MFNRNPNIGRQFDALDLSLDTGGGHAPAGPAPTHRRSKDAIRVPLAGGEFIADGEDKRSPSGGQSWASTAAEGQSMGHWISQSAETVLPGGASWHTTDAGTHAASFTSEGEPEIRGYRRTPEDQVQIESGYHGTTTYRNGNQSVWEGEPGRSTVRLGDEAGTTIGGYRNEDIGGIVRGHLAAVKAKRQEEDGGVESFAMREWNALDEEGMT